MGKLCKGKCMRPKFQFQATGKEVLQDRVPETGLPQVKAAMPRRVRAGNRPVSLVTDTGIQVGCLPPSREGKRWMQS